MWTLIQMRGRVYEEFRVLLIHSVSHQQTFSCCLHTSWLIKAKRRTLGDMSLVVDRSDSLSDAAAAVMAAAAVTTTSSPDTASSEKNGNTTTTRRRTTRRMAPSSIFLVQQGDAVVWLRYRQDPYAIVQVSRGMGPRALEQWMAQDECDKGGYAKIWPDEKHDGTKPHKKHKPLVVSPHYRAYLQSLVLVVRDKSCLTTTPVSSFGLTVQAIVQGQPTKDGLGLSTLPAGRDCHVQVLRTVPSNTAGFLSHVAMSTTIRNSNSSSLPGKFFRQHMQALGHPILGKAEGSRSFRGNKLLMATTRLQVWLPGQEEEEESVVVEMDPPELFTTLLDKEKRFWQQRQQQQHDNDGIDSTATKTTNTQHHFDIVPPPRAYQEGYANFAGLTFVVSPAVMIPRPGSQTVLEAARSLWLSCCWRKQQQHANNEASSPVILDLGTGSGCLLLTLLHWFPNARGYGVDASAEALQVAQNNGQQLLHEQTSGRCRWIHARFDETECPEKVNLVVCNPPYHIPGRRLEAATLQYEPSQALFVDQGSDGLSGYRQAWSAICQNASPGAIVAMEVCKQNVDAVYEYLRSQGLQQISVSRDSKQCIRSLQGRFVPSSTSDE